MTNEQHNTDTDAERTSMDFIHADRCHFTRYNKNQRDDGDFFFENFRNEIFKKISACGEMSMVLSHRPRH